jgi:hypothetical protein
MSKRIETLKQALTESRQHLDLVLDQVGNRWETQIYSEGARWNARQLVTHLAISHHGLNNQVVGIAEGREVVPADFDINRYNQRSVEKRAEMTVDEARASLSESHAALLAWLDTADDSGLDKTGRHASLRILSVEQIVQNVADHERGHADDLANALNITT